VIGTVAEPLLLGFSSGLVCLAACGPVLLPWLAAEGAAGRAVAGPLARFLAGRLAGYLVFACLVWALGLALPLPPVPGALLHGATLLALAGLLVAHALPARPRRAAACAVPGRGRGPLARALRGAGAPALGFATGLNLCPPFLAAGVRAAETRSLAGALAFFALFFLGTLAWFLPFLGARYARSVPGLRPVAVVTTVLVAAFYATAGAVTLGGSLLHAWHTRT
jgi:hypothetical protein